MLFTYEGVLSNFQYLLKSKSEKGKVILVSHRLNGKRANKKLVEITEII